MRNARTDARRVGHRGYSYQSLGVIELTAPGRAKQVNAGLQWLGFGRAARRYFAFHATLDVKHTAAWIPKSFARSSRQIRRWRSLSPRVL